MKCPNCGNKDTEKLQPETRYFDSGGRGPGSHEGKGHILTGNTKCLCCGSTFPTQPPY